jgi:ribosome-associated heat shock protein Hsp15
VVAEELVETRVDRWLWAVRIYKTRTAATDACRGGHVRVNGRPAKPATTVRIGDAVTAVAHGDLRELEVARVIDKRVGAPVAAACLIDNTPQRVATPDDDVFVGVDRGFGRPTKRDRRQFNQVTTRRR